MKGYCNGCGGYHELKYGERVNEDGTKTPSKMLGYVKCGDKAYLSTINGKSIFPDLPDNVVLVSDKESEGEQMNIQEAIEQLESFVKAYETTSLNVELMERVTRDYQATKILLAEYKNLVKEVTNFAKESIAREREVSKLEGEVEYLLTIMELREWGRMKKSDLTSILKSIRLDIDDLGDAKIYKLINLIDDISDRIYDLIDDINEGVFDEWMI